MFQALVHDIISAKLNRSKFSHKKMMENEHIKNISSYVKNLHVMKKDELENFIKSLESYEPGFYQINGKKISPDAE